MGLLRFIKNRIQHDQNMKRMFEANAMLIDELFIETKRDKFYFKAEQFKESVLSCIELGVSDEKICGEEVVVSLTTFGKRINEVYLAIESIMQGTVKPNRIVLWLAEDEFKGKNLPVTLQKQQKRGLQIEYCEDIRSYKKIVPTMEKYPDACVVTIDDDVMYEFDLLENLVNAHLAHPDDVCACRIHRITLDERQKPKSYLKWQWEAWPLDKSNLNFLTSGGGTLFPSHCFVNEFFNKEAFMSLCPYADDVWINAMIWMSGRKVCKAYTHSKTGCDYLESYLEQDDALSNDNVINFRNDVQIKAVMDKYDLYHYLESDNRVVG